MPAWGHGTFTAARSMKAPRTPEEHSWRGPPPERRFRSTWAAYMLGSRIALWDTATDPARSAKGWHWFQSVRTLAQEGCGDGLNLVGMSYYWEAEPEPNDHTRKKGPGHVAAFVRRGRTAAQSAEPLCRHPRKHSPGTG